MAMLLSPSLRSPPSYNEKHGSGSSNGRGRRTGLKSRGTQLLALKFGWVVLVVWYEVGEFFSSLSSCRFPDSALRDPKSRSSRSLPPPAHVVLIADPHVPHPRLSYSSESNPYMNTLRQAFDELFMRKSWNVVMRLGKVDAVIMLGDMLDWGRGVMREDEYEEYHNIFRSIFQLPASTPMHFVPGNHDIPLGPHRYFSPHARDRYSRFFSPPNSVVSIANHTLVLLDSIGLVEEDYRRYAAEMQFGEWDGVEGGVIEFVKSVAEGELAVHSKRLAKKKTERADSGSSGPNVLLSHIPLARPERSTCGQHREFGRIQKGAGSGYQNLLGSETSRFLLEELKPVVVFSGDDHDYCEHTHPGRIREVTVKSFSSSTGIRRPGFQLLSLVPPTFQQSFPPEVTFADRPCFLPDQSGVYTTVYFPFICLTVVFIFITNIRQAWSKWNSTKDRREEISSGGTWNEKGRLSPNLSVDPSRRFSDRPAMPSLPSRRSSSHLSATHHHDSRSTSTSTATRSGMHITSRAVSPDLLARSAPGSPYGSPRPSFADEEAEMDTPNLSRRSSFIYMNGSSSGSHQLAVEDPHRTPRVMSEPSSYFANRGDSNGNENAGNNAGLGLGLGLATPTGMYPYPSTYAGNQPHHPPSPGYRRGTNSAPSPYGSSQPPTPTSFLPTRRVTMPRLLTSFLPDRDREIKKDRAPKSAHALSTTPGPSTTQHLIPVLSLSDGSERSGIYGRVLKGYNRLRGFSRWVWKMRNSVLVRSCWEVWGVAWVVAVAWIVVNGLFFLG